MLFRIAFTVLQAGLDLEVKLVLGKYMFSSSFISRDYIGHPIKMLVNSMPCSSRLIPQQAVF